MTDLERSYRECRRLNKRFGKTYYYSTLLLPKPWRPHVHALYGFCRYVDDIVDDLGDVPVSDRVRAVEKFSSSFFSDLERGSSEDLVLAAVVDTVRKFQMDHELFRRFLRSMKMDFTIASYETFEDLLDYTDGSAAVIGEMLLPIIAYDREAAQAGARDLGVAFQLTNFLRDINEDLDRGRVYIPQVDIRRFGAGGALQTRTANDSFRDLIRFEIARTRDLYRSSTKGDQFLRPEAQKCIQAARQLYSAILGRIELLDFDVFATRAEVPRFQKILAVSKLAIFAK